MPPNEEGFLLQEEYESEYEAGYEDGYWEGYNRAKAMYWGCDDPDCPLCYDLQ